MIKKREKIKANAIYTITKITKATFINRKFMNNLAFVVPIHVCLSRDT